MNVGDDDDGDGGDDAFGIPGSLCDTQMEAATKEGKSYLVQDYCLGQHTLLLKQRMFRMQQVKSVWRTMLPTRISVLRKCVFKALLHVTS